MRDEEIAAVNADNDNNPVQKRVPYWEPGMTVPYGYYKSKVQPNMIFKTRWLDDELAAASSGYGYTCREYGVMQFTAEIRRAISKLIKDGKIREAFEKRQSIGNDWYDEQARITGSYGTDFYPAVEFRRDIEAVVLNLKEAA